VVVVEIDIMVGRGDLTPSEMVDKEDLIWVDKEDLMEEDKVVLGVLLVVLIGGSEVTEAKEVSTMGEIVGDKEVLTVEEAEDKEVLMEEIAGDKEVLMGEIAEDKEVSTVEEVEDKEDSINKVLMLIDDK